MNSLEQVGEWVFRRRAALVVGACALTVTMLSVGGAWALMSGPRSAPEVTAQSGLPAPAGGVVPAIMTEDTSLTGNVTPAPVGRLLEESRSRSAQAVAAGETVYAAARRSAPPAVLERLRGALDETSAALDDELPAGASSAERTQRFEALEARRAALLDAASFVTEVRRVPAEALPAGSTTVAVVPQDPTTTPGPTTPPAGEPTPVEEPTPAPSGDPATPPLAPSPSEEPSAGTTSPAPEPSGDPSQEPTTTPTPTREPTSPAPGEEPGDGSGELPSGDPSRRAPSDGGLTSDPSGSPTG